MTDIKIEKGIELPEKNRDKVVYPLGVMNVDESFLVDISKKGFERYMRHYVFTFGKKHGKKYAVRKENDKQIRIFRVE